MHCLCGLVFSNCHLSHLSLSPWLGVHLTGAEASGPLSYEAELGDQCFFMQCHLRRPQGQALWIHKIYFRYSFQLPSSQTRITWEKMLLLHFGASHIWGAHKFWEVILAQLIYWLLYGQKSYSLLGVSGRDVLVSPLQLEIDWFHEVLSIFPLYFPWDNVEF